MRQKLWVILLLFTAVVGQVTAQDLGCGSAVSLNGASIEVASVSGDDTDNIQCALDAAVSDGYRVVSLVSPAYEIGAVEVTGFVGDLVGKSIANTRLEIQDDSLTCDSEVPGSALRFNVGNAAVKQMTIAVGSPCGNGGTANVIGFYSNPADCSKRTGFGVVDRVDITGSGSAGQDIVTGVVMDAAPGCSAANQKLLGTLKLNRSTLRDLDFGVLTSLAGGAQVDINYNTFEKVGLPISMVDAYQSTTILGNTINYNDAASGYQSSSGLGTTGIFIASTAASPSENGTTIKANKFVDGGDSDQGYALLSGQYDKEIAHAVVVSGNTFTGNTANVNGAGMAFIDTKDGLVSGNTFRNYATSWLSLSKGNQSQGFAGVTVSGWAVAANDFANSSAVLDIALGAGTTGNVVAKGQDLPVVEDATGTNDVLESSVSANQFGGKPISVGASEMLDRQFLTIQNSDSMRALAK